MRKPSSLLLAIAIALAGWSVADAVAQMGVRNDGVQFPDGSVQTSAAKTPGEFVQVASSVNIGDLEECATGDIYTVPAGKRLRIEWISVRTNEFGAVDYTPVDIVIGTWLGGVKMDSPLARIEGAQIVGSGMIGTALFSSQVILHSEATKALTMRACRANDTDDTTVRVFFHGQLFDE